MSTSPQTAQVVPGFTLDEELFEAARRGLAQFVPGVVPNPTWEWFTSENTWLVIPGGDGVGYKAEATVLRTPERTVKLNVWLDADRRPEPYSYPWDYTTYVLAGGYREVRFTANPSDGRLYSDQRMQTAGTSNTMTTSEFHSVPQILAPGRTLTLMDCGAGTQGDWGYLNPSTGVFRRDVPDPGFRARLVALNPRLA